MDQIFRSATSQPTSRAHGDCARITGKPEVIVRPSDQYRQTRLSPANPYCLPVGQKKGLWEAPKPVSMMPTEVNSLCTNPRLLIAFRSPYAPLETGLRVWPPEKSRDSDALQCRLVRSLQSGLSRKNREIRACFAHSAGNRGRDSLHFRLRGGESGIRTLSTVLPR